MLGAAGCLDMGGADFAEEPVDKASFSNQVILDWSAHTRNALAIETGNQDPLFGTRTLAMVHVAMHDAVNACDRQFNTYKFTGRDATANPVAAAASAAHRVLANLFPGQATDLRAKLDASLAAVTNGLAEDRGVALGDQAANVILQERANDGSNAIVDYAPSSGPGKYQFVPPFEGFIFRPEWRFVKPWTLSSPSAVRSDAPPSLTSSDYRDDYNEVKATGILSGSNRTADQSVYAQFWYEDSDIGWNKITRDVVIRKRLNLHASARLFALVNIAMADSFIAGWDSKFHYDLWRPFTGIRAGASDNNNQTSPDTSWVPFLDTPPVQEYPSTHTILGQAAATVLGRVLGDQTTFSFVSSTAPNPTLARTYSRFSDAAKENGDSRVRAGVHFRFSVDAGLVMGDRIGRHVVDNYCKP